MGPKTLGAWLLGLCLLLGACVPSLDEKLTREGIGSDLHTPDLGKQTDLQDQYLGFICHQAGVPTLRSDDGFPRCNDEEINDLRLGWRAVITAGMNDIDRRCDSYLAWLDNKKRSKDALLSQITDTDDATGAILNFSGADKNAISIVAIAFGLIRNSIENYHSRLILEVESSTINSIVLERRNNYRELDVNNQFLVRYKPDVVHHIRSYLRLCLPFTIEMDVNDLSTLKARDIDTRDSGSVVEPRDALGDPDADALRRSRAGRRPAPEQLVIEDSKSKVRPTPPKPPVTVADAVGRFEEITPRKLNTWQSALCVSQRTDRFGEANSETRRAILSFEQGWFYSLIGATSQIQYNGFVDNNLEREAIDAAVRQNSECGFKNAFEVGFATKDNGEQLVGLLDKLFVLAEDRQSNKLKLPADFANPELSQTMTPDTRRLIGAARVNACQLGGDALDLAFVQCITKIRL
jgi:hypothetical protein